MRLKARIIATAAVLVMAAAAVFGASRPLRMPEEVEQDGFLWYDRKETIYFWYSDEDLTNYVNSAAVSFGEQENVHVIPVLVSEGDFLEAVNQETLHGEHVPDAYLVSNDVLEKAYLAGLAETVRDSAFCSAANFPKAALDAVTYDGKQVAYPLFYETTALVYNQTYLDDWAKQQAEKDVLNEELENGGGGGGRKEPDGGAELDQTAVAEKTEAYLAEAVPDTVDDLLNIADTFDVPMGVEGVMKWDVSDILYNYWFVGNYLTVGGDTGDNRENIVVDNEEIRQCLEIYKGMNQFFSIESDAVDYASVVEDFLEGKIVFTIGTTDIAASLAKAVSEGSFTDAYGIVVLPDLSEDLKSRSLSVTNCVAVNGYSEKQELADRFAVYLTGQSAGTLYEMAGKLSANSTVENTEFTQPFFEAYAVSESLPKMLETGNFWLQLEVLFSKVWNGADVPALLQELQENLQVQLTSG